MEWGWGAVGWCGAGWDGMGWDGMGWGVEVQSLQYRPWKRGNVWKSIAEIGGETVEARLGMKNLPFRPFFYRNKKRAAPLDHDQLWAILAERHYNP